MAIAIQQGMLEVVGSTVWLALICYKLSPSSHELIPSESVSGSFSRDRAYVKLRCNSLAATCGCGQLSGDRRQVAQ